MKMKESKNLKNNLQKWQSGKVANQLVYIKVYSCFKKSVCHFATFPVFNFYICTLSKKQTGKYNDAPTEPAKLQVFVKMVCAGIYRTDARRSSLAPQSSHRPGRPVHSSRFPQRSLAEWRSAISSFCPADYSTSDKKIRTNPSPLPRPPEQCWGTFQRMTSGQLCSWGEGVGFVRFFLSRVEGQRSVLSGFSDEYVQMSTTTARSRRSLHTPTGLHQGLLLLRNEPDARPCWGRSAET